VLVWRPASPRASSAPLRASSGTSSNETTALTRWSPLNSVLPAVRNCTSAAPAISQSPRPTHREMQFLSQRASGARAERDHS
jgi:hypothetical protein